MKIYNGVDMVDISRFEEKLNRSGSVLEKKLLSKAEQEYCKGIAEKMAGRFAAKEAVLKALGTGFWQNGVSLSDVEVLADELGAPKVLLSGRAKERYEELGGEQIALSISHEAGLALAFCVIITK